MPRRTLLIGKNSFLANSFLTSPDRQEGIEAISHSEIDNIDLNSFDSINFAYRPNIFTHSYCPEIDLDRNIASRISESNVHYIMLSSRMVYAPAGIEPIKENASLLGQGVYGKNKIYSENYVTQHLPGRHTILRLANVFGFEPGRHTFMGHAMRSLRDTGFIYLDIAKSATRDFLPVSIFSQIVGPIICLRPQGVFNVGSGVAVSVGDVSDWLVDGAGRGNVVCVPTKDDQSFVLDVGKLENLIHRVCTSEDIRRTCLELGKRLCNE